MAANKKPRKKYRPKGVIPDPISYVVSGLQPLASSDKLRLGIINHGSMQRLVTGKADREDWQNICTLLNVCVVMAEQGIGEEFISDIKNAMLAHATCGKRLVKHGKLGYTGEELNLVNTAIEIHDQQLALATVQQMELAHKEVYKRLLNKHIYVSVRDESTAEV